MINFSRFVKVGIIILFLLGASFIFRGKNYARETSKLDSIVLEIIRDYGIDSKKLLYEKREEDRSGRHLFIKITRQYEADADCDINGLLAAVENALKKSKFRFAGTVFEKEGAEERITASFSFKNRILYELSFLKRPRKRTARIESKGAKIAIVLDDFGYNLNNLDTLFEIDLPLTISVLPNLPFSKKIAKRAGARKIEVMLHLPLEPHGEKTNLEKYTILTGMPPQKVTQYLIRAIESVPGARGVSNHMGSKATEDRTLMGCIFDELRKRDLYFVDNVVTDKSVCKEVAFEKGVRIAARSVFLDNELDEEYIEKQIRQTARLAEKTGWALGVGHDRTNTIKVLARIIPQLKDDGFEFAYVSEIAK